MSPTAATRSVALQTCGRQQRLGNGEAQKLGCLAEVLGQRLEVAEKRIAVGIEGQADRQLLDLLLVFGARQVTRTLIEHGGEQAGGALLASSLLRTAAVKGKANGDDGQAFLLDQPSGYSAGTADLPNVGGARPALHGEEAQEDKCDAAGGGAKSAGHRWASAGCLSDAASSPGRCGMR